LHVRKGQKGLEVGAGYGEAAWYTGCWVSPGGTVYISDADGYVHIRRPQPPLTSLKDGWEHHDLPFGAMGVFGVDDDFVLAWGGSGDGQMSAWQRGRWVDVPSPGSTISVHGQSRNLIYAVGDEGLIARWDGSGWQRQVGPTEETLTGVFVADEDHIW